MIRSEGTFVQAVDRIGGLPVPERAQRVSPFRHVDVALAATALVLVGYGVIMVLSVTAPRLEVAGDDPATFLRRQLLYAAMGLVLAVAAASIHYRRLKALAPVLYAGVLLLLAVVLTPLGSEVSGARRWIEIGPLQMQPSEFAKAAVLIAVATYLARLKGEVTARHVIASSVLAAVPAALIFLEPDLGTAIVLVALFALFLVVCGAKLRHLFALAGAAFAGLITVINLGLVHDYQIERITSFLDTTPDVRSAGYNLTQSKIAIASGGIRGKGLRAAETQTELAFVPEQHTDFVFTAVGEQLGFIGSAFLLGLFAFLIWRALRIAAIAGTAFGTLLAAGIAILWAVQVFVNVGMTMGIMPITGTPLPFISFGGSSLLTNLVLVGLLENVHMRRFL